MNAGLSTKGVEMGGIGQRCNYPVRMGQVGTDSAGLTPMDAPGILPCPHWPPDDGAAIGLDAAREIVAWLSEHAPQVVADAERMMRDRYPGVKPTRHAATVGQLATWRLTPEMRGLVVGCVACAPIQGQYAFVNIVLLRDGRLVARPGLRME